MNNQEVPRDKPKPKASTAGPGLLTPDLELFCKAGPDGKSLGDCPFTHYVQVCDVQSAPPTTRATTNHAYVVVTVAYYGFIQPLLGPLHYRQRNLIEPQQNV